MLLLLALTDCASLGALLAGTPCHPSASAHTSGACCSGRLPRISMTVSRARLGISTLHGQTGLKFCYLCQQHGQTGFQKLFVLAEICRRSTCKQYLHSSTHLVLLGGSWHEADAYTERRVYESSLCALQESHRYSQDLAIFLQNFQRMHVCKRMRGDARGTLRSSPVDEA